MKRKIISLAAIFVLGTSIPAFAAKAELDKKIEVYKTAQKVALNGKNANIYGYTIDGYNYFKLRDVAAALKDTNSKFNIEFDQGKVLIKKGQDYTITSEDQKAVLKSALAEETDNQVFLGEEILKAKAYKIGGYNYYKLRDLSEPLGFVVDYNKESDTILIYSNENSEK